LSGLIPSEALADAGFATERDLIGCEQKGVTLYSPYRENTLVKSAEAKSPKYRNLTEGEQHRIFRYRCSPESCLACLQSSDCTSSPEHGSGHRKSEREDLVDALKPVADERAGIAIALSKTCRLHRTLLRQHAVLSH